MGSGARTKLGAALLLGLFLCAMVIWLADWYVESAYKHVVVEVSNVAGIARIDVNCRRAVSFEAGDVPRREDLGWLGPEDRIYLSVYNERGAAAWGFKVIVNGEVVRNFSKGHAGVTGGATGPYKVAMAQMVTADGDRVGSIGCGLPGLVSDSLATYQQVPRMRAMLKSRKPPLLPRWDPPRYPFALIEGLAGWLPVLGVIGWVVALSIARVRQVIVRHRVIGSAVVALELFLALSKNAGPETILIWLVSVGLSLLLVSAAVTVWPHTGSRWLSSSSTPDPKPNPE